MKIKHERFQRIIELQADILIHGCTPTRRKRMYNLLKKFLPMIDVEPTDDNIRACWFEG